jgi:hypothetical protein
MDVRRSGKDSSADVAAAGGRFEIGWGEKKMKKVLGCLSMAALAVVLAAPVSAQTVALNASVPFDFVVGGRTMPAGSYLVSSEGVHGILAIRNESTGVAPTFIISNAAYGAMDSGGGVLTFNRYGSDYFLAKVWDGSRAAGRSIPMSKTERERVKSSSLGKPEVVTILARR